jgi:hypothetical protein
MLAEDAYSNDKILSAGQSGGARICMIENEWYYYRHKIHSLPGAH